MKNILALLAVTFLGLVSSGFVPAGSSTGSLAVATSIFDICATSTGNVAMGNYTGTQLASAAGNEGIYCTNGTAARVTFDQGANAGTGSTCAAPLRRMKSASGNFMNYNLYTTSRLDIIWGCDATHGVNATGQGILVKAVTNPTVMISAGQDLPAGSYSDTITMTITY
jgi:spore coat protein U-like protein